MGILPLEADAPLLVDPDTVLALAGALQSLQLVRGRNRQIFETTCSMQLLQLHQRPLLDIARKLFGILSIPDFRGLLIPERLDHVP